MFERFTEKAIKVVTLSQEEAGIAKHSKLYPEHLLLGILREGSGISAKFLRVAGLSIEELREKVKESLVIPSKDASNEISFSSEVKQVLREAWDKAKSLGANYISPEHLLLSLLNHNNTSIIKLLEGFDIDVNRIKDSVARIVERKSKTQPHPEGVAKPLASLSPNFDIQSIFKENQSSEVMNTAKHELGNSPYELLGTEHLLLALLNNKDSQIYKLLENSGITYENFVEKLKSFTSRADEYNNECLFTPKALYAINSAFELAKELGYACIQPEHILLGILREKGGIAYKIVNDAIDPDELYSSIIKPIEKQKPITLTIIRLAKEEARRLGHNIVGTEQILLGILGESSSTAAKVLQSLGVTLKDARLEVEKLINFGNGYSEKEMLFSPRAKKLLETAWSKAKKFNQTKIESEHLLLAIINDKECMAMTALAHLGVDSIEVKQGILKAIENKNTGNIS